MGAKVSRNDFHWTETKIPHTQRRIEMLRKYPEIKQLFGVDPIFKWTVSALVVFQILSLLVIRNFTWPMISICAYCLGGIINHALMLAIHEIGHCMAFGTTRPLANKLFSVFANLPIVIPFSISFKYYHAQHHKYLATDTYDPDVPTELEAKLFSTTFGKLVWIFLQPVFYSLRPVFVRPIRPTMLENLQTVIQLTFDIWIYHYFGLHCLLYLMIGSLLAMGFHPIAGHFIAEHYMFRQGYETYSYYGPLNIITFNVGYHNEHHDFPLIPGSRLPKVRKIAPEYYDTLPSHTSWCAVIYHFITDPNLGLYARMKRRPKEEIGMKNN